MTQTIIFFFAFTVSVMWINQSVHGWITKTDDTRSICIWLQIIASFLWSLFYYLNL